MEWAPRCRFDRSVQGSGYPDVSQSDRAIVPRRQRTGRGARGPTYWGETTMLSRAIRSAAAVACWLAVALAVPDTQAVAQGVVIPRGGGCLPAATCPCLGRPCSVIPGP